MSQKTDNSRTQCLNIIMANPGLCGEEIGHRCKPSIQVNTVEKNIKHIRDKFGKVCIKTIMIKGENDGVKFATYYWLGINQPKEDVHTKIAEYRRIQARYPRDHRQWEAIETQIRGIEGRIGSGVANYAKTTT